MQERLLQILEGMDVPALRRSACEPHHLRWLERNLAIRNSGHPDFLEAMRLIRQLKGDTHVN